MNETDFDTRLRTCRNFIETSRRIAATGPITPAKEACSSLADGFEVMTKLLEESFSNLHVVAAAPPVAMPAPTPSAPAKSVRKVSKRPRSKAAAKSVKVVRRSKPKAKAKKKR